MTRLIDGDRPWRGPMQVAETGTGPNGGCDLVLESLRALAIGEVELP